MDEAKTEITRLINLYIDGAGKGDGAKLTEAFHASSRLQQLQPLSKRKAFGEFTHLRIISLFQSSMGIGRSLTRLSPILALQVPNSSTLLKG